MEIKAPDLTVMPDTLQPVSPIDPAKFYISGYGDEDLKRFTITTNPFIYSFDTTFGVFTHVFNKTVSMTAFDNMQINDDSIITVKFVLSDDFHKTEAVRYLRLLEGYPPVKYSYGRLCSCNDSNLFYSAALLKGYNCENRIDGYVDFLFIVDTTYGYTISSPDAPYSAAFLTNHNCYYNTDNKNHTHLSKTSIDVNSIDPKLLYNLEVEDSYIGSNPEYGTGITDLHKNDEIAFISHDNRKGIIKIRNIDYQNKCIIFDIYTQAYPVNHKK